MIHANRGTRRGFECPRGAHIRRGRWEETFPTLPPRHVIPVSMLSLAFAAAATAAAAAALIQLRLVRSVLLLLLFASRFIVVLLRAADPTRHPDAEISQGCPPESR